MAVSPEIKYIARGAVLGRYVIEAAEESGAAKRPSDFGAIFRAPYLSTTIRASLLTTGIYGGNYVMITWLPAYLKMVLHMSVLNAGGYLAVNILGSFCGAFVNGFLADGIGRRKTFLLCACVQTAAVATYTLAALTPMATLLLGFVLAYMASRSLAMLGSAINPSRVKARSASR